MRHRGEVTSIRTGTRTQIFSPAHFLLYPAQEVLPWEGKAEIITVVFLRAGMVRQCVLDPICNLGGT